MRSLSNDRRHTHQRPYFSLAEVGGVATQLGIYSSRWSTAVWNWKFSTTLCVGATSTWCCILKVLTRNCTCMSNCATCFTMSLSAATCNKGSGTVSFNSWARLSAASHPQRGRRQRTTPFAEAGLFFRFRDRFYIHTYFMFLWVSKRNLPSLGRFRPWIRWSQGCASNDLPPAGPEGAANLWGCLRWNSAVSTSCRRINRSTCLVSWASGSFGISSSCVRSTAVSPAESCSGIFKLVKNKVM